jgi:NADPH:quinone reductase-like Zn-dependent oxidoreductase
MYRKHTYKTPSCSPPQLAAFGSFILNGAFYISLSQIASSHQKEPIKPAAMTSIVNKSTDEVAGTPTPSGQHLAAILPSKYSAFELTHRPTPTPGPNELLIEVKAIALNPIDHHQRYLGVFIAAYPAVIGSDIAGTVITAGASVPRDAPKPGTRVAAFAPCFYMQGAPDYGAFQTRVLVPAANAVPLPDRISFNEGSVLPMAVLTTWAGLYNLGVPRDTAYTAADKKGMLVWGGSSSVGSAAVQVASLLGFTVYTTASEKHHEYLKSLGASKVFDYRREDVVESIVKAAKEDGLTIQLGYLAAGQLQSSLEILKELKGEGTAKLASAPLMPENPPNLEGVEAQFVVWPKDEEERMEFTHFVFGVWLKEKLETGEFVPSPKIQVIEGGLESVQKGVDEWKKGVSGVKLVLEV